MSDGALDRLAPFRIHCARVPQFLDGRRHVRAARGSRACYARWWRRGVGGAEAPIVAEFVSSNRAT